jgi:hypothetical protein
MNHVGRRPWKWLYIVRLPMCPTAHRLFAHGHERHGTQAPWTARPWTAGPDLTRTRVTYIYARVRARTRAGSSPEVIYHQIENPHHDSMSRLHGE